MGLTSQTVVEARNKPTVADPENKPTTSIPPPPRRWRRGANPPHDVKQPGARIASGAEFFSLGGCHRQAAFVPAAHCARGLLLELYPDRGVAERRQALGCMTRTRDVPKTGTPWRFCESACAPMTRGRAPLGAPPWRFSAGPALPFAAFPPHPCSDAPRSQVVVPGGRGPLPPEPAVTSRSRGTPRLAPPTGLSPETPLDEQGYITYTRVAYGVKRYIHIVDNIFHPGTSRP